MHLDLLGELDFNWKYKDYELRACPASLIRLSPDDKNTTINVSSFKFSIFNTS